MTQPPPQRQGAVDPSPKLGTADVAFWFSIIECVDVKTIDFEKFAEMCCYKNVKTAKKMFYLKRKQMRQVQGGGKVGGGGEKGVKKEKDRSVMKREVKEEAEWGVVKQEVKEEVEWGAREVKEETV